MKATLTFWNGTDTATGSEFMLRVGDRTVLVDCGLTQGMEHLETRNRESFAYHPNEVDTLFVTHAHMDHIGRVPKLIREGFSGKIYSTEPTRALSELMFHDALKVMTIREKEYGEKPLYEMKDVIKALSLWKTVEYGEEFKDGPLSVVYKNAGHILGSGMVEIKGKNDSILFTGDLGNTPHDILPDTDAPGDVKYMVMESVYGDRNHEDRSLRRKEFKRVVTEALRRGGALLIPVFSLERSQDILYELNSLVEANEIPRVPIFLDSPLAIDITHVYEGFPEYFNERVQEQIQRGDDIFSFPGLLSTHSISESKEINEVDGPKIIIAGSGMSHGGRIQHHEIHHLGDPNTTILFVGYQIPGSVGRRILDGEKKVDIYGRKVKVRAHVEAIFSYSAHKDSDNLQEFAQSAPRLKELFIVLGEPKSRMFLSQRLHDYHNIKATLPERKESFDIEL